MPETGAGEQRKVVTILFADVIGSTALGEQLDPERLRALLGVYFAAMAKIIESWGGTAEKCLQRFPHLFEAARTQEALALASDQTAKQALLREAIATYESLRASPHAARAQELLGLG